MKNTVRHEEDRWRVGNGVKRGGERGRRDGGYIRDRRGGSNKIAQARSTPLKRVDTQSRGHWLRGTRGASRQSGLEDRE